MPPAEQETRDLYFRTVEIEVETEVSTNWTGEGKANFYVVKAGGRYKKGTTQRIKVKMHSQGHLFPKKPKSWRNRRVN